MEFLYFLESIRNPFLDTFFSIITHLGSETLFVVIAIIIFWCVSKQNGYYLLTVGFFGTVLNQFLKLACQIPRPWVRDPSFTIVESARADATGYSFPSGHTQSITGSMGSIARFTKDKALRALCIILIALTAFSRMYLGVHTPADVITSLVIGTGLVFAFYPIFQKSKDNPGIIYAVLVLLTLCGLALVLYTELYPWGPDVDPHNLASGVKNGYMLMGCSIGMLLAAWIEGRYINFEVKAVWWAQLLKVVLGLLLVLAIKSGLKAPLNALFNEHHIATAIRYFLMVVFAACVWPITFRWFSKLGENKES